MAYNENCRAISANAKVTASASTVLVNRFVTWATSSPGEREVIIHVPAAAGAPAVGVCGMKPDVKNVVNGFAQIPVVVPDGCIVQIELGEIATQGAKLRVGGNSTEVDGAAYLADASGDYIVGYALTGGAVGEIIPMYFINLGLVP